MRFKGLIGFLVVVAILFSYMPVFSMDGCPEGNHTGMDQCPEGNHTGNVKMDCGSLCHCPMIVNENILGTYSLPLNGRLVPAKSLLVVDELIRMVFHPPKDIRPSVFRDEGMAII